jgi:SAM-dependent methyltransferase
MTTLLPELARPGPAPLWRRCLRLPARIWLQLTCRAPDYVAPTAADNVEIEQALRARGVLIGDLHVDAVAFREFRQRFPFPADYSGGAEGGVFVEKLLEHHLAHVLLGLDSAERQPYVDVAACASPWAMLLRQAGVEAWAIDLAPDAAYLHLPYYQAQDATRMSFGDESVGSASLQCAFEMFEGGHDTALVRELSRVLKPGGRAVILPLYMHTHACHYATLEWVHDVSVADAGSKAYVRRDSWGIRSSRKYSAETLGSRVLEPARTAGLKASVLVLRNAREIDPSVYLHFVLVIDKPAASASVS